RPVSSAIAGEVPAKPVLAGSVPDNHHPQKSSPQHAVPSSPASGPSTAVSQRKRTVKDFTFGVLLGEGSYSTVVEATEIATNKTYAAKILYKRHIIKEKKTKYVQIERDVLHTLNHPFIVKLYYAFQDRDSLYLVLDLASNGELLTWVRKLGSFPLHCARFYLAEIVTAVEYMHSKGIIHRDLKPENILLGEDMHILITDFGTAFQVLSSGSVSESRSPTPPAPATTHQPGRADSGQASSGSEKRANSFVGTAEYVSPELLKDKAVTKASDVWAIGCIAYQLLAGRPPFKAPNEYLTFQKILRL
ncbi:serine/threonine protein kinase, partial [Spiromyces aspiralis]